MFSTFKELKHKRFQHGVNLMSTCTSEHRLTDALLEIINALAHLVDAGDDAVGHLLEARLHLRQEVLHLRVSRECTGTTWERCEDMIQSTA